MILWTDSLGISKINSKKSSKTEISTREQKGIYLDIFHIRYNVQKIIVWITNGLAFWRFDNYHIIWTIYHMTATNFEHGQGYDHRFRSDRFLNGHMDVDDE